MIKIIKEQYLMVNNRLEIQRFNEKWFISRELYKEWEYLKSHNIVDIKSLYMFENNETDKCECSKERRFISYSSGFKKYCEHCSRTKYNSMKNNDIPSLPDDTDFILRDEIKKELINVKDINDNYSIAKLKKNKELSSKIIATTFYMNSSYSERIYHIVNDMYEIPKCKKCGGDLDNFISKKGYRSSYCIKNKCIPINKESYNSRKLTLLKHFYPELINKYKNMITSDYEYKLFSLSDYIKYRNDTYIEMKHKCGHEYKITIGYQGHIKCPKCYPIRSKVQYEIYEYISEFMKSKFNDRKLIKPKEIDILTDTFGIEYDSISYHSYGYHSKIELNNILEEPNKHLEKTELCEKKNIQLFRIFSNEWYNYQDIWKSVLNSKMNNTNRIYARKCIVKNVNYSDSKEFLDKNHLQGYTNSSIRLGLYYNNELVQLMTFSKSRYNKSIEYELIRMCSLLNTTVIGGASKLLKYFERNYNPESIISYANRRWSEGNVYYKLGFEFIENTKPNYFYFKGNDKSKLLSRVQFQKHKLKNKLDNFNSKLTETENMFNNGYRKIYDSGNKVFIKRY